MNKLSLCMIVKNEEKSLPKCLASVKNIYDELIVVDTGSSDDTINIAKSYNARVVEDLWKDNFSYARNISLDHASNPWILWLDADDIMPEDSCFKIKKIKNEFSSDSALGFKIINSTDGKNGQEFIQIRMFPNNPQIRFEFRVHEQVLPPIQRLGMNVIYTDISVLHTGYTSNEVKIKKQERNLILIEKDIKDQKKDHPVILYTYAGTLVDLGRIKEAIGFYERAYKASKIQNREKHIYDAVPIALAIIGFDTGDMMLSEKWIRCAKENNPENIQIHFVEGRIAEKTGDYNKQRESFEKVLVSQEVSTFIPIDYRAIKLYVCVSLSRLYSSVFMDKKRMVELLEQALKLQGKEIQTVESIGERFFIEGDFDKAITFYKTHLEKNKKLSLDSYKKYITALNSKGEHKEVVSVLKSALEQFPSDNNLKEMLSKT